ncbi:MAG: hypothetical protein ACW99U_20800 [Candidatus Thorarchaeota archaeon]|jgi:hypothetical protein
MEEAKKIFVGTMVVCILVGMLAGGLITYRPPQDCPDCNLICPDVIDYGEDYDEVLEDILRRLNDNKNISKEILWRVDLTNFESQAVLDAIRNSELNISEKMALYTSWLFGSMNYTNLIIWDIKDRVDAGIFWRMPEDYVDIEYYEPNVSVIIGYYNNSIDAYDLTPTIPLENWTLLINWTLGTINYDIRTLTNFQIMQIVAIANMMAYYKETGTWLGE